MSASDTNITAAFYGVTGVRGRPHNGHRYLDPTMRLDDRDVRNALPAAWRCRQDELPPPRPKYDTRPLDVSEPEGVMRVQHLGGWTALAMWDRSVDTRGNCLSVFFLRGEYTFATGLAAARDAFPTIFARFTFPIVDAAAPPRTCSFCGAPNAGVVFAARSRAAMCFVCLRRSAALHGTFDEVSAHEARVARLVAMLEGAA